MLLMLASMAMGGVETVLLSSGDTWSYYDAAADPSSSWYTTGFDDSAWDTGPSPLGYGTFGLGTEVEWGTDGANKPITSYYRSSVTITGASAYDGALMTVRRDDGAVVYFNGTEIWRSNLPSGVIGSSTLASVTVGYSEAVVYHSVPIDPSLLLEGNNVIAVEVHQDLPSSLDLTFDATFSVFTGAPDIVRVPYIQNANDSEVSVRWRTDYATGSEVAFGPGLGSTESSSELVLDHEVRIGGLDPHTRYDYEVGAPGFGTLAGQQPQSFQTNPEKDDPARFRFWATGDFGTANFNAEAVRDGYLAYVGNDPVDFWLMLGDNAYNSGLDHEYQTAVFEIYEEILAGATVWSTLGNHDGYSASSFDGSGPYYEIFTHPMLGEAGGIPSGTEAYYSFDYGNVHFICLDSYDSNREPGSAMLAWLEADLQATTADWTIAFWHHPPYSKGSHDSDYESYMVEMREGANPILEAYGVDLVLSGHSHSYERSKLIDGHYGLSETFNRTMLRADGDGIPSSDGAYTKAQIGPSANQGTVYTVAGSSGQVSGGTLDHPAMQVSLNEMGSVVVEVDDDTLQLDFIDVSGAVSDTFTLEKGATSISHLLGDEVGLEGQVLGYQAIALDPDGNAPVSYVWDMGDGGAETGASVNHTYVNEGTYEITVVVTDAVGGTAERSMEVSVVNGPPVVDVLVAAGAEEGETAYFWAVAHDPNPLDVLEYSWDFGDGEPNHAVGDSVEHVYAESGFYTVNLLVSDGDGGTTTASVEVPITSSKPVLDAVVVGTAVEEQPFTLVALPEADVDPDAYTWSWELAGEALGEGLVVTALLPDDGRYEGELTITDALGLRIADEFVVDVDNANPEITKFESTNGVEGELLSFSAAADDVEADKFTLDWNFGDGSALASGAVQQHVFADDGSYFVGVTAADEDGGSVYESRVVSISNAPPSISLLLVPERVLEGDVARLAGVAYDPGVLDVHTWSWQVGDQLLEGSEVELVMPDDGVYEVAVTVTDDGGLGASQTWPLLVVNVAPRIVSQPPLVATVLSDYVYEPVIEDPGVDAITIEANAPLRVTPDGRVTFLPTTEDEGRIIDFTLVVSDDDGASVTQSWSVRVDPAPAAAEIQYEVVEGKPSCGCSSASGGWSWLGVLALVARRRCT